MKIVVNGKSFFVKESTLNHQSHWQNVNNGNWEPQTFKIFDEFLDKKRSCIDLGAWIGSTVLYSCQLSRHVYAAEPDEIAINALTNNILVNSNFDNITLYCGCISNKCGKINLGAPGGKHQLGQSASSIFCNKIVQKNKANCITFTDFVMKYNITDCNFIKMDIEGAEGIVLPTMKDYIISEKPIMYISLHPWFFSEKHKNDILETLSVYNDFYVARTSKKTNLNSIFKVREIVAK